MSLVTSPEHANAPDWLILNIPHDSTFIPSEVRDKIVLNDEALGVELLRMTDHHTSQLFEHCSLPHNTVRAMVSRLVVDTERFLQDDQEPMSQVGMGAIYTRTSDGRQLRHDASAAERTHLLTSYYVPHHAKLAGLVSNALRVYGRALILDGYSFASKPLAHEASRAQNRPDICIGTDEFHTPPRVKEALVESFQDAGFSVALNDPFSGCIVPAEFYCREVKVHSVMVEVNRRLYMNEESGERLACFEDVKQVVTESFMRACAKFC